jgi:DNA-binding CsgD family transcriptional regulator
VSRSQGHLRQAVRQGIARMKERRQAEQTLAEAAREYPEMAAKEMLVFARTERDRLRRQLLETFGFSVSRDRSGFRCRFAAPKRRPRNLEEAATWLDAVVALVGFEMALDGMWLAGAYFPPSDRARMISNAFSDVMRETPAVYGAFANCEEKYAPGAREYASAMLAAWTRSHLKRYPTTKAALEGPGWENELVSAAILAFQELDELDELDSDAQIKRGTRFRDTLPRQVDGRRQRASGEPDLINRLDRILSGRISGQQPKSPEHELARFAEREALLRRGREVGLPPREYEYLKLLAANPRISYSEAARELKIAKGTAKKFKHNIMKSLKMRPGAA